MNKGKSMLLKCVVTFLLFMGACSQLAPDNLDNADTDSKSVNESSGDMSGIDSSAKINSSILLNNQKENLSIVEEITIEQDKYLIKLSASEPLLNVMKLSNPPRLVVDVASNHKSASQEVRTSETSAVSGIRLGSHSEKTRIVFDLRSEEALSKQSVQSAGNDVLVSIPVSEDSKPQRLAMLSSDLSARAQLAPVESTDEISAAPSLEEKTIGESLEQTGSIDNQLAKTEVAEEEVENTSDFSNNKSSKIKTEIATNDNKASEKSSQLESNDELVREEQTTQIASNNDSSIMLEEVDFTKTNASSGEVTLKLTTPVAFELSQTAQSEYVLILPKVKPSEDVLAPRISTKGKDGIRTVRVVEEDDRTLVRFFVDAGITLSAIPRDHNIFIKPSTTVAARNSSARGQLADPSNQKTDEKSAQANPTGFRSADGSKIYAGRLISLDLQDTDIDNALRIIAEVSNLNIIASEDVAGKVTLRLIDVPWDQALDVILKTNGLDQVTEGNVIRIAPVDKLRLEREALRESKRAAENLEDLTVQYARVSYARAEDVKAKVESVLSERGSVTADDRTNQLIIKDIQSGQKLALDLLKKLDMRTPQVLLETQIVEGNRSLLRDLGFQWNFSHVQSPATGNATGINFPNSVNIGGGTSDGTNPWAVNFPSVIGTEAGSAITAVLDSADGSKLIAARLSALEQEGKARIVSRPQVATLNNKQAKISSVTTIRIRTPNAGTTVATGAGASADGGGGQAFASFNVGIELDVTPQASPDRYVLMDVNAVSSSFSTRPPVDNIPATVDRKATSSILVKSGQTFALGGVYRLEEKDDLSGIPFLKDIPFLGAAFRRSKIENSDEELLFFITPHIVEGSFDASAM